MQKDYSMLDPSIDHDPMIYIYIYSWPYLNRKTSPNGKLYIIYAKTRPKTNLVSNWFGLEKRNEASSIELRGNLAG